MEKCNTDNDCNSSDGLTCFGGTGTCKQALNEHCDGTHTCAISRSVVRSFRGAGLRLMIENKFRVRKDFVRFSMGPAV